jgi:hypothetical protein
MMLITLVLTVGTLLLSRVSAIAMEQKQATIGLEPGLLKQSKLTPFEEFILETQEADFADFDATAVESEVAFNEMKAQILWLYTGVTNTTSFVYENVTVDCINLFEQASVRNFNIIEIPEPPLPHNSSNSPSTPQHGEVIYVQSMLTQGLTDPFDNAVSCPDASIPMTRMTLEILTTFPSLAEFFYKSSVNSSEADGSESTPQNLDPDFSKERWAQAFQVTENFGGNSFLNVWDPAGYFSLSQVWYEIGSGRAGDGTNHQTVEGGWVQYESKFGTTRPVFFIFTTPDDYHSSNCWNHECGKFVQINKDWHLGGPLSPVSSTNGEQWGFEIQWKLYNNNWWLFVRGASLEYEAIGYYPLECFYPDGMLYEQAGKITYGGEVHRKSDEKWPVMGSGKPPNNGFGQAAFQSEIFFIPQNEDGGDDGVWADLGVYTSDDCYNIDIDVIADGAFGGGSYIYFGGPGAQSCGPE